MNLILADWKLNANGGAYKSGCKTPKQKIIQIMLWKLQHTPPYNISQCALENQVAQPTAKRYLYTTEIELEDEEEDLRALVNSPLGSFIIYMRTHDPAIYLRELQALIHQHLDINISTSTISKLESKMKYSLRHINSFEPEERNTFRIKYLRYLFSKTATENFFSWQFLVSDESHISEDDFRRH